MITKNLFEATRHFELNLRDFDKRTTQQQMYANFVKDMTSVYDNYIQKQRYTARAGYHSANAAVTEQIQQLSTSTTEQLQAMSKDTTEAITNLANAALSDRSKLNSMAKILEQQQKLLQYMQQHMLPKTAPPAPNNQQQTTLNQQQATQQPNNRRKREPKFIFYCHTHGYTSNPTHTSKKCRNPGENHNYEATPTNTMGGNMNNKDKYDLHKSK